MHSASFAPWAISLLLATQAAMAQMTPVSSKVFANLIHYQQYAAAAYADSCAIPPFGSSVLIYYDDVATDTHGTLFKDSAARQIIVAFRGTSSPANLNTDLAFSLVPLTAAGTNCGSCMVHQGFQSAYAAISSTVISTVKSALASNAGYKLVVTGHSLGGGIASIAAASLAAQGYKITVYTYGEPRNGDSAYTSYINGLISTSKYFRVTHANDGVPQIPPTFLGYQHHGTEHWESNLGTNSASSTYLCPGVENPTCNNAAPYGAFPINGAHISYGNALIGNSLHIAACGASPPLVNPPT